MEIGGIYRIKNVVRSFRYILFLLFCAFFLEEHRPLRRFVQELNILIRELTATSDREVGLLSFALSGPLMRYLKQRTKPMYERMQTISQSPEALDLSEECSAGLPC